MGAFIFRIKVWPILRRRGYSGFVSFVNIAACHISSIRGERARDFCVPCKIVTFKEVVLSGPIAQYSLREKFDSLESCGWEMTYFTKT